MTKHTRGPWVANFTPRLNVKGPDKKSICAIVAPAGKQTRSYEEHCSNARLISAAPELLEALERAYLQIIEFLNEGDFKREVIFDAGYIVDALEKAKGVKK